MVGRVVMVRALGKEPEEVWIDGMVEVTVDRGGDRGEPSDVGLVVDAGSVFGDVPLTVEN